MTETEESNTPKPVSTGTSARSETFEEKRDCRWKGKKAKRQEGSTFKEPKFSGHTKELKDDIFYLNYNMSDQYTTTTRAIVEHVGRKYKNDSVVKTSIEELAALVIFIPPDPVGPNILESRIW